MCVSFQNERPLIGIDVTSIFITVDLYVYYLYCYALTKTDNFRFRVAKSFDVYETYTHFFADRVLQSF